MRKDCWAVKGDKQGNKGLGMRALKGVVTVKGDVCELCLLPIIINIGVDQYIKYIVNHQTSQRLIKIYSS